MNADFPLAVAGQRIGLLGGSFDPAHEGHLHITEQALRRFDLDRVWWLVSPGNPLKVQGPAPLSDRIKHAQSMIVDPRIIVTGLEAKLGIRMTADTIGALKRIYPKVKFVWLMGSDNLVQFDQWDRWREIAGQVPLAILARPGSRLQARGSRAAQVMLRWRLPDTKARLLAQTAAPAWALINVPMSNLSSSAIRAQRQRLAREGEMIK